MQELWQLFSTFARIGLFTFGGGYAMLPLLQREVVERHGWATEEALMDYFAIGQCTPGVIAVNVSTFIGYRRRGISGSIFATLGVIFPSLIIITVIAMFLQNFAHYPAVVHAFNGIRACVCVLIFNAVFKIAKRSLVDGFALVIFIAVAGLSLFKLVPPVLLVLAAGLIGVVINMLRAKEAIDHD